MNGYIAIYNGKKTEVYADSLYAAKQKAITEFRAPKSKQHMISVMLAEKGVEAVIHSGADL